MTIHTNNYCLKETGLDTCAGDQEGTHSTEHHVSFRLHMDLFSSSSAALLIRDFLNRGLSVMWRGLYGSAGRLGARGGEACGSICQQKHGQYVLVRKLTSQSTGPVALFGVHVHSREWMCQTLGYCFVCCDVLLFVF